ncbi:MAG: septal ring lytic transglycosylase RlpA family protein [Rhodospirillales bacterium]|nr:septal ring lytic transglycosylase RlpA family protein [Rhodospirillales bacterium]MCW8862647.1 septal ring lytic transglycosylase RlpA family protein [Rhodospirillales bacterium]MCW8951356.1 septal ring lytic transglycosylase RlpA family protein [Rhodospirillales bacterium]
MMRSPVLFRLASAVLLMFVVSGCAETQFLAHYAKRFSNIEAPPSEGRYKVGKPYQINNVWYYPAEDPSYDETGIASWYGPNFHRKQTANGEIFDMNELSAAHRTLPMPSFVRVTNLENGRSIELRVNDRGPFAHGRILDVSRRAAQLLGFENQGTARVRVQINREKSYEAANSLGEGGEIPPGEGPIKIASMKKPVVTTENLAPPPGTTMVSRSTPGMTSPPAAPEVGSASVTAAAAEAAVQVVPVQPTNIFIQVGAFSRWDNANRVKAILSSIADVNISSFQVNGAELFRVRIGPVASIEQADGLLESVISGGYPDARVMVD